MFEIAIWSKLAFWRRKKEEDLGSYTLPGLKETSLFDEETKLGMGFEQPEEFEKKYPTVEPSSSPMSTASIGISRSRQMSVQSEMSGKDIELIIAKLDSIRVNIDLVNKRLENLERIANQ